jgi:hypothetical protein
VLINLIVFLFFGREENSGIFSHSAQGLHYPILQNVRPENRMYKSRIKNRPDGRNQEKRTHHSSYILFPLHISGMVEGSCASGASTFPLSGVLTGKMLNNIAAKYPDTRAIVSVLPDQLL